VFAGSELVALWVGRNSSLWAALPIFIAMPVAYWLLKTERKNLATAILITAICIQSILLSWVQRGLGLPTAVTTLALITALGLGALPRRYLWWVILAALTAAVTTLLIDIWGSPARPVAEFSQGRWVFMALILALCSIFLARQILELDIRTKIVLGILGTGGLALAVAVTFVLSQGRQVTDVLSQRLESSVRQLAEEHLNNTAFVEANKANQSFEAVAAEAVDLAQNWVLLRGEKSNLGTGAYWDASTSLVQLEGGQHGNSATEPSSVFVPIWTPLDDTVIRDLNISAYLDFHAPQLLSAHPALLAVYAIDKQGVTRYYPNIELASLLPPDFDATHRPYFTITAPLFNPQRLPRWTIPYADATGGGLVVTVAAPVYENDEFFGVVAADMQLTQITQQINSIKVGETGYAFMLDDAGRILSMPPPGFDMFGIRPDDMGGEDFFKQSILGLGTPELQALTKRMTSGGRGLLTIDNHGVDTYVSFAPVKANGYSVALVVPVSELQGAIVSARNQTQQQIQDAIRVAVIILVILLVAAVLFSLGLGQVMAAPIQRLTQVASQIAGGDLSVKAVVSTKDEIGILADSFNTMTSRLRETLDGLEQTVEDRTSALISANEKNERRAKQFESIAEVARTISSTRDLEVLLPQITAVISREFGFYHVGIFLLDAAKEYAVLSAANSPGGGVMLERGHKLRVGETGIVGYVTGTGEARVAHDTGVDAIFFNNPDLPNTRSEIALPLRAGQEVVGALDVQSTEPNAFSQEDINILSTLADQVSIAIQNAKQFEQTRKALNEAESLAKQFAQMGWQQYTKDKNLAGIHHTGARSTLLYGKNGQEQEISKDQVKKKPRGSYLTLPIKLRGEVIGSVDVHSPDNRPWDQDELDIVTAIIERAAIAMENARLLEESQRLASKEAKISEVTAKISSSINMRNVLQAAVEELGHALPGSEILIQFQTDQNKSKTIS
jgi:GAF domain-containing protein/HAMP domain-containing protein